MRITWTVPRLTTEGTRVRDFGRTEIYALFVPSGTTTTNFVAEARRVETLTGGSVPEAGQQSVYDIVLTPAQIHQQAFVAVRIYGANGREAGFSNIAPLEILDLPQLPSNVDAKLTEKAVVLTWNIPGLSVFGGPAPQRAGYQIYRADDGPPQLSRLIGTVDGPAYRDTSFEFGHKYIYSVRSFTREGQYTAISSPSTFIELNSVDTFPPAPPQNVRAIPVPGAVELAWSPNSDSDLAGYNVYRTTGNEGGLAARSNPQPLQTPVFRDTDVAAGTNYSYRIRALDKFGNEGAPSDGVPVTGE